MATNDHLGAVGSLVSAALVASCCLGPVLFLLFGETFAVLSPLRALRPYRAWFIAAAIGSWSYGFYRLYGRRSVVRGASCEVACERPSRGARVLLWVALGVLVAAITYPDLAVRLLG